MKLVSLLLILAAAANAGLFSGKPQQQKKPPEPSMLDKYVNSAMKDQAAPPPEAQPGALWSPNARLNDFASDPRASHPNDVVTIVVTEAVNAVAGGVSQTQRQTSATETIPQLFGLKSATGALTNMLSQSGNQQLNGQGTTSRTATLNATMTARVVSVLPGGMLLIEGSKNIQVNSEVQDISVRGVIRTADITTTNTIASIQIADMEIHVNGKGVVGDAVRRPNALYRFLLGLLPF